MLKFTKTDRKSELDGIWLDYDDGLGNVLRVKVARSDGNPHYESKLTRLMSPYQKKMEKGKSIGNDVAKRIMTQVAAEELLLDWDSAVLLDDEGKPTVYSKENSLELLTQDTDLREFVIDQAGDQSNFLKRKK